MKRFSGHVVFLACLGTLATVLDLTAPAFGNEPIIDPDLPEAHSPCTFDLDARLIQRPNSNLKDVETFNCDGAHINSLRAVNSRWFRFTVGLRRGHDKAGTVEFRLIDGSGKVAAIGEAYDNLDQGEYTNLTGGYKLTKQEFARVFAEGQNPKLRITLRVE